MITTVPPPSAPSAGGTLPAPATRLPRIATPFHALFFKSLIETCFVLFAAWTLLGVTIIAILYSESYGFTRSIKHYYTLMDPLATAITLVACAIFGFVLGFIQFRTIAALDQWALLIHRPLSRTRLFVNMLLSGLILYSAFTLIPLLLFIVWAVGDSQATPHFYWAFLLPHAASFLVGLAAFATGILSAQYQKRRTIGITLIFGNAALAIAAALVLPDFSTVMIVELLIIAANLLAAWGATLTHAEPQRNLPRVTRAGQFAALLSAFIMAAFIINSFASGHLNDRRRAYDESYIHIADPPHGSDVASIVSLDDGRFAVQVTHLGKWHTSDFGPPHPSDLYSLSGMPLPNAKTMKWNLVNLTNRQPQLSQPTPMPVPGRYRDLDSILPRDSHFQIDVGPASASPPLYASLWRPAGETILYDNFDDIATNGAKPYVIVTESHIYIGDDAHAPPKIVIPLDPAMPHLGLSFAISEDEKYFLAAYLIGQNGYLPPTFSMPIESVIRTPSEMLLPASMHLQTFDQNGNQIDSAIDDGTNPTVAKYASHYLHQDTFLADSTPLLIATGVGYSFGMSLPAAPLYSWLGITWQMQSLFWEPHVFGAALSINIAAAIALLLLARRYRLSRSITLAWLITGLLFGPLMILQFLCFHPRPAKTPCPNCHKPRPVNEDKCPHCKAAFPLSPTTGTEIFAIAAPPM